MKVYQNDISSPDYSTLFSGDFDSMPKKYLARLNIPFYVPFEDEFKLTFDKKLLSTAERYNLLNLYNPLRVRNTTYVVNGDVVTLQSIGIGGGSKSTSIKLGLLPAGTYKIKNNFNLIQDTTAESGRLHIVISDSTGETLSTVLATANNNGTIITFTILVATYIVVRLVVTEATPVNNTTIVEWYDLQLVKVPSIDTPFPEYQVYYGYESGDMWDNVDYCTFEETTDFTPTRRRYYFIEEIKTQVASGVREFSFKVDKWMSRQYNTTGLQLMQTGGHLGASQNTYTNFDYIVKPILSTLGTTDLSGMPLGDSSTSIALVVIYKTPVNFITLMTRHTSISSAIDNYQTMMSATQFKYSDGGTPFNIEVIACYIIPSYFCISTAWDSGGSIYIGTWYKGTAPADIKYLDGYRTDSFTINTSMYSDSIASPTKRAYILGTLGSQYLSYGTVPTDATTGQHKLNFIVSFNLDKVVVYLSCNETGGMFIDISKDFEETIAYSTFDLWYQQNKASIVAEGTAQVVGGIVGVTGAFLSGNVSALTSSIDGVAKLSASIYDKKRQSSTMKGSGSGMDNMLYTAGTCFFLRRVTFINESEVVETIKALGYRYSGVLSDTTLIPTNKYLNYYDGLYSRYIEGEVIPSLLNPSTPSTLKRWVEPDIKDAFKRGVYVYFKS